MKGPLELRDVACVRGGRTLFSALTHKVTTGELLRVTGANGAGKTSLLRLMCGMLDAAQGQVLWRGQKVAALREELGRDLIYLGHAAALKDELSPLENLQIACMLGGHRVTQAEARRALEDAGLRGHWQTPARRLSQGQRRRSALARLALPAVSPNWAPLWVLDEPFNALDSVAADWLTSLIQRQLQRGGMVVLTSHQHLALDGAPQQVLAL